ncbi:RecQ family ATP-dependent DNA helicase [Amphibacillus xylanus]|uniref:ATP-dependent DNA helicase RecQ n=1 Tax=Amphibacillus xylanus (strain ATCC 51415 / DSM 6626 / JCM 7361 / LMG 17667 / NBRC 15112 / Ep01) TaxID=698758 RepID=K0IY49_AMPXN|nr:ATP-dependent DNA helicase RecQ [Amphibacillus xylanus]BAM47354.1 ATP-dependent DNA helicase RecQ [Amphibacillus xylanus NBRC 15112]
MNLEELLYKYFGYQSFRQGQKDIIQDILSGNHVFATLPTGSGKSICFQLPAMIFKGHTIVVTPLLSLMEDQVKQLKKRGFKRVVAINSFNSGEQRANILNRLSDYQLIYLSPEMLQNQTIINRLSELTIDLFVVDEAHCISQWGHEFRPDYLKLNQVIVQLGDPTVLALTATATPDVQLDIINHFSAIEFNKHLYPIDRDNISLIVEHFEQRKEKDEYLINLFQQYTVPTIIYFSSKKETERVANLLNDTFSHLNVAFYHGGLETNERLLIQEQFIEDQIDIICSTSAFGMGIDKSNIRLIIHYHIPTRLESFIQEIGRAGRDQLASVSITLITPNDQHLPRHLIESELPTKSMIESLFTNLDYLHKTKQNITLDQVLNINEPMNEIQRQFIQDNIEQTGIIDLEQQIDVNKINLMWKNELIDKIERRTLYKHRKLREMMNWVYTTNCRREALYQSFQSSVKEAKYFCCDQCGFTLNQWSPESSPRRTNTVSWQLQLKSILLPFETGGTNDGEEN